MPAAREPLEARRAVTDVTGRTVASGARDHGAILLEPLAGTTESGPSRLTAYFEIHHLAAADYRLTVTVHDALALTSDSRSAPFARVRPPAPVAGPPRSGTGS